MLIISVSPYYSVDSENFIEANSLVTPIHIKPEWYFLFAYAILRSIPNKIGGVICLVIRIFLLYIKPFQKKFDKIKFNIFNKINKIIYFFCFLMLTYLGAQRIDHPYEEIRIATSLIYFIFLIVI